MEKFAITISTEAEQQIKELVQSDSINNYSGWHQNLENADRQFQELKKHLDSILAVRGDIDPNSPVYAVMEHIWLNDAYGGIGQGAVSENSFYESFEKFLGITQKFILGLRDSASISDLMSETPLEIDGRGNLKAIRLRALAILSELQIPSFFYDIPFNKLTGFLGIDVNFWRDGKRLIQILGKYLPDTLRNNKYILFTFPWIIYEELVMVEKDPGHAGAKVKFWILSYPLSYLELDGLEHGTGKYIASEESELSKGKELILKFNPGDRFATYDVERKRFIGTDIVTSRSSDGSEVIFDPDESSYSMNVALETIHFSESFKDFDLLNKINTQSLIEITQDQFNTIIQSGKIELLGATARLHSDDSLPEDKFQYELYAEAIASIIRNKQLSPPPLNIAIIAPWGHGKTTLMRFIKKRFESPDNVKKNDPKDSFVVSFGALLYWFGSYAGIFSRLRRSFIRILIRFAKGKEAADSLKADSPKIWTPIAKKNPVIWFNPWHYQSSEQIWAGLGHAMITQLTSKLDAKERELFWLRLRLKRIDTNAIRKAIHKIVFESALPWIISGFIFLLLVGILWSFGALTTILLGVIGISFLGRAFILIKETLAKSVEGKFAEYVREPEYTSKLGLYHEINEDLCRVCDELIDKDYPAIVFIDDLDRCSPKVVAEVIEAINLLMTSDFRDRCYFIFGMDAQMVSAALDAQYLSLAGRYADKERIYGSIGWYFLDKFIQLPFIIPIVHSSQGNDYLSDFFSPKETFPNIENNADPIPSDQLKADARNIIDHPETYDEVSNKYKFNSQGLRDEMVRVIMTRSKDSYEIGEHASRFGVFLDSSPRGLKRFANLLRFYHTIQVMKRSVYTSSGEIATTDALAKWLVINLRWPQMVRWIQWEYEEKIIQSKDPMEKAKSIDDLIYEIDKDIFDDDIEKAFKLWESKLKARDNNLRWLHDKDLFRLLFEYRTDKRSSLCNALEFNVW